MNDYTIPAAPVAAAPAPSVYYAPEYRAYMCITCNAALPYAPVSTCWNCAATINGIEGDN